MEEDEFHEQSFGKNENNENQNNSELDLPKNDNKSIINEINK